MFSQNIVNLWIYILLLNILNQSWTNNVFVNRPLETNQSYCMHISIKFFAYIWNTKIKLTEKKTTTRSSFGAVANQQMIFSFMTVGFFFFVYLKMKIDLPISFAMLKLETLYVLSFFFFKVINAFENPGKLQNNCYVWYNFAFCIKICH